MKRTLASIVISLVLASAMQAQAGNHIGVGRWFGLGWGPGYHAGGSSGSYGAGYGVEYDGPEEIAAPEAVNTSRLTPSLRKSAVQQVPSSSQSPAANPSHRPRGEARRPLYGPTQFSQ